MFASTRHTSQPESYYHGEGRVALTGSEPRFQYKLTDHLGNTMVLFEDRDGDGIITTESMSPDNPALVEVLQRNFYYAFGLPMQGPWNHAPADPDMPYLYNGKELEGELGLGWYAYGFRYYDASVGRFAGVDPIASQFPHVSVFNYAENRVPNGIDLWGLQFTHFTAIPYGNGSMVKRSHTETHTSWTQSTFLGDATINYPLPKAYILSVGFQQFIFNSPGELFRAAQSIDWEYFYENHEIRGDGFGDKMTLENLEESSSSILTLAEKTLELMTLVGKSKGADNSLGARRSSNRKKPDQSAKGDHSVFDETGNATYKQNHKNPSGFDEVKRTDVTGRAHQNPDGSMVETPHVHEKGAKGVRPAEKGKDY